MSSPPTLEEVTALLEHSAYNPSIVPQLEAYARATAQGDCPYNFNANRTLIKLYLFFPHLQDEATIALVWLLALVQYPKTHDFLSLLLVPERIQSREPCATIMRCADLLDSCQFVEFWTIYETLCTSQEHLLKTLALASKKPLLQEIIKVLALTFRSASTSMVLGSLNLNSSTELMELNSSAIESVSDDTVVFVTSSDNTKRNRVFQEGVNFGAISSMMIANHAKTSSVKE